MQVLAMLHCILPIVINTEHTYIGWEDNDAVETHAKLFRLRDPSISELKKRSPKQFRKGCKYKSLDWM
jgi:hypothetical protein